MLLGISAAVVGAVRHIHQVELTPFEGPRAPDMGDNWKCPDECLDCCQAHKKGILAGMHTNDRFKCWLKNSSTLPPGCDDAEAEVKERNDAPGFKVTCPFGDGLTGGRAKERRKLLYKKCSTTAKCCCPHSDKTNIECLPTDIGDVKTLTHLSRVTGQEHRFIRDDPQMANNGGACINTSLVPVEYEELIGNKKVLGTHGRCCLRAQEITHREIRGTRSTFVPGRTAGIGRFHMGQGNNRVTRFRPAGTTHRGATRYTYKKRIHCVEFEKLWRCHYGSDRGLTQAGIHYKRVPKGQCMAADHIRHHSCSGDRNVCDCGEDGCKM